MLMPGEYKIKSPSVVQKDNVKMRGYGGYRYEEVAQAAHQVSPIGLVLADAESDRERNQALIRFS
jgi:hypothetical protein